MENMKSGSYSKLSCILFKKELKPSPRQSLTDVYENLIVEDNKVWVSNSFGKSKVLALMDNDAEFFLQWLKFNRKHKFSSSSCRFIPTEEDWNLVREECNTIFLNITTSCNSKCKICYRKDEDDVFFDDEMSLEDIKFILSKIGRNKNIMLFGGEPTIRKDFFKILELVKKHSNRAVIFTNGLKMADREFVRGMKNCGVESVRFSFDGFTEDIYEKMRGGRHEMSLKLKALDNLKSAGIKVLLSSTIIKGVNDDQIGNILDFALRNNDFIKSIYFFGGTPYVGRFDVKTEKLLTTSDLIKILEKTTNNKINQEYYLEFYRFINNLNIFFRKFGLCFPKYFSGVLYKIKNDDIYELVPLSDMKMINNHMEDSDYIRLIKYLVKYLNVFSIKKLFELPKSGFEIFGPNALHVYCGNIITPFNYLPLTRDALRIVKDGDDLLIMDSG